MAAGEHRPRFIPLVQILRSRASAHGDDLALAVWRGPSVTYATWLAQAARFAARLHDQGVRPGDRVLLLFDNADWTLYAVAYAGTLLCGATATPLRISTPADRLGQIMSSLRPRVVVTSPAAAVARHGTMSVEIEAWAGDPLALPPETAEAADVGPTLGDDPAEVLYTSGTTGIPRGVVCTQQELTYGTTVSTAHERHEVHLHSAAFGTNFNQEMLRTSLVFGATVVVLPDFSAAACVEAVRELAVDRLRLAPLMVSALTRLPQDDTKALRRLREVSVSSAPCPAAALTALKARLPTTRVAGLYSLTESGRAMIRTVVGEDPPGALGRPVGATEVRITDDGGPIVPTGHIGQICLRNRDVPARSYLDLHDGHDRDEGDTGHDGDDQRDTHFTDGWLLTGDLGYLDDEGFVFLTGRRKDLIVVGGHKVAPLRVEDVILEHPDVTEVAVTAVPHPTLGETVGALVAGAPSPDLADLQRHCAGRLEWFEIPQVVRGCPALPRNDAGKVARREVARRLQARDLDTDAVETVALPELVETCRDVLGDDTIQANQSWVAAGADSFSLLEIVERTNGRLGVQLPLGIFFEAATIADAAAAAADYLSHHT